MMKKKLILFMAICGLLLGGCQDTELAGYHKQLLLKRWKLTSLKSKVYVEGDIDVQLDTNYTSKNTIVEFKDDGTFTSDSDLLAILTNYPNNKTVGRFTFINDEVKLVFVQLSDNLLVEVAYFHVDVTNQTLTLTMNRDNFIKSNVEVSPPYLKSASKVLEANSVLTFTAF
jgi:hypothetical protein